MQAKIVTFALQKGGSGKTSSVINMGGALAHRGRKILLVDMDPQCNTTNMFLEDTTGEATIYDILKGDIALSEAIHSFDGIDLVPCDKALKMPQISAPELFNEDNYGFLRDGLLEVRDRYDYILIDTPPSTDFFMLSSLIASDGVIIPIVAEKFSFDGLSDMVDTCDDVVNNGLNSDLKIYGLLINSYRKDQSGHRNTYNLLVNQAVTRFPVIKTPIRFSKIISAAQDDQLSLFNTRYQSSIAAEDYLKASKEFEKLVR